MRQGTLQHVPTRDEIEAFLQRFFRAPNVELSRVLAATGPSGTSVQAWIALLRDSPGASVLLPCANGPRRHWYGLAFGDREFRVLSEDVLAFVGPSYSTYRGGRGEFDAENPTDRLVLEFTRGHALKLTVPSNEAASAKARNALDLMREVVSRRPANCGTVLRPTGRVLRDFYMALRAGDRDAAERHIRYLAEAPDREARLSPLNVLFLRVQALAELGAWAELLLLPEFGELVAVRRPLAVTQAVLAAIYRVHLQRFEATGDASAAVAHFRGVVYPQFGGIFGTRSGLRTHEAVTLFMLLAVAGPSPNPALLAELRGLPAPDLARRDYRVAIAAAMPEHARIFALAGSRVQEAANALRQGDFDRAFALALEEAPSVESAGILLDSAYELHTSAAAEWASLVIGELPKEDRALVLATRTRTKSYQWASQFHVAAGGATAEDKVAVPLETARLIAGWFEWLRAIKIQPGWARAQQAAREGAIQWAIDDFLTDARGVAAFANGLFECADNEALRLALPHLLEFFQNDSGWPRAELALVYEAMAAVLVYSTYGGLEDYTVFYQLVQGLLTVGASPLQYEQIVGLTRDLISNRSAPVHLDWMLDMVDLLITCPCPVPDRRIALLAEIAGQFSKYYRYVTREQVGLFRMLATEVRQPEIASSLPLEESGGAIDTSMDSFAALARQSVGVYTLTESAGRRFAEFLRERCPGATIVTNFDHVASDRLREMARNVDILVMVTASAKHPATEFIEKHRPRDRVLLRPSGKGTGSMLRALTEHLARTTA